MFTVRRYRSSWAALLATAVLVCPPGLVAQTKQSKPLPVSDLGWPRAYDVGTGNAVIYQPQVESWTGQTHLIAWSAVAYTPTGAKEATLGTIKLETDTKVALQERLVELTDLNIVEANFPKLSREDAQALVAGLKKNIPEGERVIALDRVLAAVDKSSIRPRDASGIKADPPRVFYSTTPALLVVLDGEPVWSPIMGVDLKYAVNTNWDLFQDDTTKRLYLRNNDNWLRATDIKGPWLPAGTLPSGFSKLPADDNWNDVRASLPGRTIGASAVPAVYVSTQPAELLLLKGAPTYQPVTGTSLMWVNNTESDLFRMGKSGLFYYLVAGRWFSAPALQGPWTFATPDLPEDFKKIPVEHPRSRVLASVPGTDQAAEAVLLAMVPQVAR